MKSQRFEQRMDNVQVLAHCSGVLVHATRLADCFARNFEVLISRSTVVGMNVRASWT